MVKSPCCEKISVKKGVWSVEEDAKMLSFVSKNGSGNWTSVSKKAGLKSCGKSCSVRWNNYLRPDLKQDNFTPQEEDLIIKLHAAIGSRWSIIAQQLPGKTDNDVKNYWNTRLKKKLTQMGIDPVTHKPFSKLIADYGNIGGSQKPSTQIGSVNKDLRNSIQLKSEPHQTLPQGFRNFNSHSKQPLTSPTKMEPTENSFLFNRTHNYNLSIVTGGASNCIDLENETIPSSIFGEGCLSTTSSSSPSTSSTYSTVTQEALPVPFSWNDFLLEDVFAPSVDNLEQEKVSQIENVTRQSWNKKEVWSQQATSNDFQATSNDFQLSSSNEMTFVEAMLDQENEMFLSFPHLLEEPFNY